MRILRQFRRRAPDGRGAPGCSRALPFSGAFDGARMQVQHGLVFASPARSRREQIAQAKGVFQLRLDKNLLAAAVIFVGQTRNHLFVCGGVVLEFADSGEKAATEALADFELFMSHAINLWGRLKLNQVVPMISGVLRSG